MPRPRSRWVASGSSKPPISTLRSSGPARRRRRVSDPSKSDPPKVPDPLTDVFHREAGRCTATLIRVLGDIDLAEDAVAEAFAIAAEQWPVNGVPPNPGGWITTTARNRAIDRLRREATRTDRYRAAALLADDSPPPEEGAVRDDRLRMLFTCCHPALAPAARVALTLRLVGGLSTAEIAHAFLVPEATMAQRLVRAKHKI